MFWASLYITVCSAKNRIRVRLRRLRELLLYRLMRSQLPLLFTALIAALVFPSSSPASRAKFALSIWVMLVTAKVHFTGITLARTSLSMRGADARRRQWGALALTLGA